MKISLKRAIFNRYNIIAFVFVPIVSFLSWAISPIMFTETKNLFANKVSFIDYLSSHEYKSFPVWGFSYMQILLPLLAAFVVLPYLSEKRMYNFSYTREKSYPAAVLKPILRQLLIGCTVLFLGDMVFLCAGLPMNMDPDTALVRNIYTDELSCSREFMPEIFGRYFLADHMFLFFVVDGFWKYFVFCFIYGLFSVSVSFYTKKDFLCLIVPTVYYIVLDLVFSGIGGSLSLYAPSYPIMSGADNWVSIPQVIYPLLPPLLFAVFTFVREFTVKKKRADAYAV